MGFNMYHKKHLIFDLDDTLVRTQDYITEVMTIRFLELGKPHLLKIMLEHLKKEGGLTLDVEIRDYVFHEIIAKQRFMLEALPTRLFNYFFLIPGNIPKGTKVSVCTHRGYAKNGLTFSKRWFEKYKPVINIEDFHCLDSKKTPDKIKYLKNLYGNDFYLIDDNPFHDVINIHEEDENVLIYDECCKYKAYQKQHRLVFDNGIYKKAR